jgi:hypothetical protein
VIDFGTTVASLLRLAISEMAEPSALRWRVTERGWLTPGCRSTIDQHGQ